MAAMAASNSILTTCLAVAFLINLAAAISRGMFVNPYADSLFTYSQADPAQQFVYLVGAPTNLTWQTTLDAYECILHQQNVTSYSAQPQNIPLYSKSHGAAETGTYTWNVSTGSFNLNDSPIFYITCTSDVTGNNNQYQGFQTYFFNLTTDANDPRLEISRKQIIRNIAANEVALGNVPLPGTAMNEMNTSCGAGLSSSAKVGLGVGIGLGVPILLVLGVIAYKLLQTSRIQNVPASPYIADPKAAPEDPWNTQQIASASPGLAAHQGAQPTYEVEGNMVNLPQSRPEDR